MLATSMYVFFNDIEIYQRGGVVGDFNSEMGMSD
jgi:hypothetical protein